MPDAPDRRLNAYRPDLADATLRGKVEAKRFTAADDFHVVASIAPVHVRPSACSDLETEALGAENVRVFEISDGWAWCQLAGDGYVGYLPADALAPGVAPAATHKVASAETFAYAEPTARSRRVRSLLLGTRLSVIGDTAAFFALAGGGYIGKRHAEDIGAVEADYVTTAMMLAGAPYLWGGKSVRGVDCSGLVQLALCRAGVACPRDTDMQARMLAGDLAVGADTLDELQRGDIVYWPRHVGIMVDRTNLLHANGTHMTTLVEPLTDVVDRSRGDGPVATAIKRLA
ncbi:MAG: C40 family peptidase [Alphaproteobacteria bacterium]|nr:C40 family peptidase [Alphaproteobacteria bacterium]